MVSPVPVHSTPDLDVEAQRLRWGWAGLDQGIASWTGRTYFTWRISRFPLPLSGSWGPRSTFNLSVKLVAPSSVGNSTSN